jgi:hypothetical protein
VSKGRPSVVSLDAQTTRSRPSCVAAWNTLKFIVMFVLNVSAGGLRSGPGMFARWMTLSASVSASTAWP